MMDASGRTEIGCLLYKGPKGERSIWPFYSGIVFKSNLYLLIWLCLMLNWIATAILFTIAAWLNRILCTMDILLIIIWPPVGTF